MDPAKIPYHSDTEGYIRSLEHEGDLAFNSDHSADETYDYESSSVEDDYYLVEDFTSFKDVARSKKFYLKKKPLEEAKLNELEDVFLEKLTEEESDSEEEKIIQVVWSEDDPVQNKLVRFVEALEMKKSNSKFTLSMLDEERISADIDSCEGEEIKGRFLEVKDSLEVIATSSRNLHGSKYSDWDISVDEDQEVNRIWRKSDSPWTSSLQIEIGKLPSQADQETVLQVLEDGAQGKISVRDVTECLGNLLDCVNQDKDIGPNKKVSFCDVPSKSCLSKESLSQSSSQSGRGSFQKKVSFCTENNEGEVFEDALDKASKKVSFYELAFDDEAALLSHSENGKIKKSVSFHDSVEFEKSEKGKDTEGSVNDNLFSEANADMDSGSSTDRILNNHEDLSNHSGIGKSTASDINSGYSLAESFSTFSTRTSFDDSLDVSECRDLSDLSLHSSNQEDGVVPIHLLKFLNDQINTLADHDALDVDGFGPLSENTKGTEEKSDRSSDSFKKLLFEVKNEVKSSIRGISRENRLETNIDKNEFIRNLIEDSLNKKLEEYEGFKVDLTSRNTFDSTDPLICGIGKTFKLFYEHCREMVDINNLSKSMGLAMAFQDHPNSNYLDIKSNEQENQDNLNPRPPTIMEAQGSDNVCSVAPATTRELCQPAQKDEHYMSADSDGEMQVNRVSLADLSLCYTLNKYIFEDYPPFADRSGDESKSGASDQKCSI